MQDHKCHTVFSTIAPIALYNLRGKKNTFVLPKCAGFLKSQRVIQCVVCFISGSKTVQIPKWTVCQQ